MKQYGVLVIGCGHIGQEHLADIYFRSNICIVGVVDTNLSLAEECCRKYNAKSFSTDYNSYLLDSAVDIVIIATYTDTHFNILQKALAAQKHVLCEKPFATNLKDGSHFLKAVQGAKTQVLISHVLRHNETYLRAAELIHSGLIGQIKVMRMVQNHHCMDWARYKRLLRDCTPVLDCGVHYFDVMQWFTRSRITQVQSFGTQIDSDLPAETMNYCVANVRLDCGAIGYYEAGWSTSLPSSNLKQFIGDKGSLQIVLNQFRADDTEEGDLIKLYLQESNEYKTINVQAKYRNMWAQLEHLIEMIERDITAWPAIEDAFSAFKVAITAQEQILRQYSGYGEILQAFTAAPIDDLPVARSQVFDVDF